MAEVGGVGGGLTAGSGGRVELGVCESAASPGDGSAVDTIDVWEWVSSGDVTSWVSLNVDGGGSGDECEEFHFYVYYYNIVIK